MRHLLVTSNNRIVGVQRINMSLRHGLGSSGGTGITLRGVANRRFVLAREDDIVFNIIRRMYRHGAVMAVVVGRRGIPRANDVRGIITKEHVADSVADSIRAYPD